MRNESSNSPTSSALSGELRSHLTTMYAALDHTLLMLVSIEEHLWSLIREEED